MKQLRKCLVFFFQTRSKDSGYSDQGRYSPPPGQVTKEQQQLIPEVPNKEIPGGGRFIPAPVIEQVSLAFPMSFICKINMKGESFL